MKVCYIWVTRFNLMFLILFVWIHFYVWIHIDHINMSVQLELNCLWFVRSYILVNISNTCSITIISIVSPDGAWKVLQVMHLLRLHVWVCRPKALPHTQVLKCHARSPALKLQELIFDRCDCGCHRHKRLAASHLTLGRNAICKCHAQESKDTPEHKPPERLDCFQKTPFPTLYFMRVGVWMHVCLYGCFARVATQSWETEIQFLSSSMLPVPSRASSIAQFNEIVSRNSCYCWCWWWCWWWWNSSRKAQVDQTVVAGAPRHNKQRYHSLQFSPNHINRVVRSSILPIVRFWRWRSHRCCFVSI